MSIQLAMVGLVVADMRRSLEFYRRLGLDIPADADERRFVMHRMPSGVTIFFDTTFFPGSDPERRPAPRGTYNISLEFYARTRDNVDRLWAELTGAGYGVAGLVFLLLPYFVASIIANSIQRKKKR